MAVGCSNKLICYGNGNDSPHRRISIHCDAIENAGYTCSCLDVRGLDLLTRGPSKFVDLFDP